MSDPERAMRPTCVAPFTRLHAIYGLVLICLQCVQAGPALSDPTRVASLNLCTDQLLLALADPQQIASITFLAQHEISSYLAAKAANYPLNYGQAEEIIPLQPDLVVGLLYTSPSILRLLERLGIRVELFPFATNAEEVATSIRRMAALIGQDARGEQLIIEMTSHYQSVQSRLPPDNPPRGLYYEPRGYTAGSGTLKGELMRIAGWRNVASELGIESFGVIGLESLVLAKPHRLILSPYAPGTQSLAQRLLLHPALRTVSMDRAPLIVPPNLWICGGPMNTEAVDRLIDGR